MTTLTDDRTLTDRALAASADRVLATARAMDRPHLEDEDLVVVHQGERGFFTNVAYVMGEPDWDGVLARVATVVPDACPVSLLAAGTVPDLSERGWVHVGRPPLMVRPVGRSDEVGPAELRIEPASDRSGLEVFERTLVDSYPDPSLQPYRWGSVHDERVLGGRTRYFVGTVDGRPVATASGHVAAGINVVEMVATVPEERHRGYGAALTRAATLVDPDLPAALIASDLGRPVYEALGYVAVSRWTFWHRPAPE